MFFTADLSVDCGSGLMENEYSVSNFSLGEDIWRTVDKRTE
jgi:hypothetical protein